MKDAHIAADEELNYLRSYISGVLLQLVDNYRKRQGTLTEVWTELETRFGNVTQTRMHARTHAHESILSKTIFFKCLFEQDFR